MRRMRPAPCVTRSCSNAGAVRLSRRSGGGEGTPRLLQSAKFFSCLDLQESRTLYQHTTQVGAAIPHAPGACGQGVPNGAR